MAYAGIGVRLLSHFFTYPGISSHHNFGLSVKFMENCVDLGQLLARIKSTSYVLPFTIMVFTRCPQILPPNPLRTWPKFYPEIFPTIFSEEYHFHSTLYDFIIHNLLICVSCSARESTSFKPWHRTCVQISNSPIQSLPSKWAEFSRESFIFDVKNEMDPQPVRWSFSLLCKTKCTLTMI